MFIDVPLFLETSPALKVPGYVPGVCSYRTMFGLSDQLQYTEGLQDDTASFSSHIALRL